MTTLLDVRVTFVTARGELVQAVLGDVPHDAVATALRSLRGRVEFERRAERLKRLRERHALARERGWT